MTDYQFNANSPDEILIRKIDEEGCLPLPRAFCRALGVPEGGAFSISLEGDRLVLRKADLWCRLCAGEEDLWQLHLPNAKVVAICRACRETIAAAAPPRE